MTKTNFEIKTEAMRNNVRLYELPPLLGYSQSKLDKLLRTPLSDKDKAQILTAIDKIAKSR